MIKSDTYFATIYFMKLLTYLFFTGMLLLSMGYFLFFTAGGNRLLLPFVNSYMAKNIPSQLHAKVTAFRATPTTLEAQLLLDNTLHLDLHGPVSWLKRAFNLQYRLRGSDLLLAGHLIPGNLNLGGKAYGVVHRFSVEGNATVYDAQLTYRFDVHKEKIRDLNADIRGRDLSHLLALAGVTPLVTGTYDLHLHTPVFNPGHPYGKADITVSEGGVERALFRKRYGVDLPEDFHFSGEGHATLHNAKVIGSGMLQTTLGNLVFKESRYDAERKSFNAKYHIFIPRLSALQPLIHRHLRGSMEGRGHVYLSHGLRLEGVTESFGGKIVGRYENGVVVALLRDVSLRKLLYTLSYPQGADGEVFAELKYALPAQSGEVNGTIHHAHLLENQLTKAVEAFEGIDLRQERFDKTLFNVKIEPYQIFFTLDATAPKNHMRIYDAHIKPLLHFIDARFEISLHGKVFSGRIKGDLSAPQVELDAARYIKSRIGTTVDKYINKKDQKKIKSVVKKELKNFGLGDLNGTKIMNGVMDIFF